MKAVALGIDVSKNSFDSEVVTPEGKRKRKKFNNNEQGFRELSRWLSKHEVGRVHACMESTSIYHENLALYLHAQGHIVSVVNPAPIKAFAQSEMLRNKTDPADAGLIRRFCEERSPRLWEPPSETIRELRALSRHLEDLKELRQQQLNRLETSSKVRSVTESLNRIIEGLDQQIAAIEKQIEELIGKDPDLRNKAGLLQSIPGIGEDTAAKLLAEVPDISAYSSARQLAAHAGLTPRNSDSGKRQAKARLSKIGNAAIRKALYFPAIVAKNHNPIVKSFCENLLSKGKCKMAVICAAMRKLIHIVYGVLKSNKRFDPKVMTYS